MSSRPAGASFSEVVTHPIRVANAHDWKRNSAKYQVFRTCKTLWVAMMQRTALTRTFVCMPLFHKDLNRVVCSTCSQYHCPAREKDLRLRTLPSAELRSMSRTTETACHRQSTNDNTHTNQNAWHGMNSIQVVSLGLILFSLGYRRMGLGSPKG